MDKIGAVIAKALGTEDTTTVVFMTNVHPGKLEKAGLGQEKLRAKHPSLVYGLVTQLGLEGPHDARGENVGYTKESGTVG